MNIQLKTVKLIVGNWYTVGSSLCFCIKCTNKGINLVSMVRGALVFKSHLYDRKFSGKPAPRDNKVFYVVVPRNVRIYPSFTKIVARRCPTACFRTNPGVLVAASPAKQTWRKYKQ